jgi:hypothetical protein
MLSDDSQNDGLLVDSSHMAAMGGNGIVEESKRV